jgi:hypothetical protein
MGRRLMSDGSGIPYVQGELPPQAMSNQHVGGHKAYLGKCDASQARPAECCLLLLFFC